MKLTTKILIGGLSLIIFIYWLSFHYLGVETEKQSNSYPPHKTMPPEIMNHFPASGIDLVYCWNEPGATVTKQERMDWLRRLAVSESLNNLALPKDEIILDLKGINTRGPDYFRFFLRSISYYMPFVKRLFIVYPDSEKPSPSLNITASNPTIELVPYGAFIPRHLLPTFNPSVVHMHLHRIEDISEEFLLFNDHTFLSKELSLDQLKNQEGKFLIRTLDEQPLFSKTHDEAMKHTYEELKLQPNTHIDTTGPLLLNKRVLSKVIEKYSSQFDTTSKQRFEVPNTFLTLEAYFQFIINKEAELSYTFAGTITDYIKDDTVANITNKLNQLQENPTHTAFHLTDNILRGRINTVRNHMEKLFISIYPFPSHLETAIQHYETIGLIIALSFFFFLTFGCYGITRALGGHIKQPMDNKGL